MENKSEVIENAIKKATHEYPNLDSCSDYAERIAEFLPDSGWESLIPQRKDENSFQWAERVDEEISTIWNNI